MGIFLETFTDSRSEDNMKSMSELFTLDQTLDISDSDSDSDSPSFCDDLDDEVQSQLRLQNEGASGERFSNSWHN